MTFEAAWTYARTFDRTLPEYPRDVDPSTPEGLDAFKRAMTRLALELKTREDEWS